MPNCDASARVRRWHIVLLLVIVLAVLPWVGARLARGGIIFSDNFAADPLGSVPVTPQVGSPWVTSATSPSGIQVVADPLSSSNGLQLGPYRSTVVMPFSLADQVLMSSNANLTLSFQYHSIDTSGMTPYLDISGLNTATGDPAFLYRIMPQVTSPSSGLHEIYYLNPTDGLTDTGLAVSADSLQLLTVSANFSNDSSQLSVGTNMVTLPLYTCPSMIQEASLSSYVIGSGGISYTDIDQVTATTTSPSNPGPDGQIATPEPGMFLLLLAAAGGPAAWWLWRWRRSVGSNAS